MTPKLRKLVVDAPVMTKSVIEEPDHELAVQLLRFRRDRRLLLIAPALAISTVARVLTKRVRRGEISAETAIRSFKFKLQQSPRIYRQEALYQPALRFSLAHGQEFYDCLYLKLALQRGCDLITDGGRFYVGICSAFRMIRLLTDPLNIS